jgi:putative transcriptional regulator
MQNHKNNEDFQARTALYALGTLSEREARDFEDELALASDAARAEVAEFDAIVAQLGLSAPEATPSAQVRDQLLARIARESHPTKLAATPATTHLDIFSHEGKWTQLFEGVYSKVLFVEPTNGYVTSLLKMTPGSRVPNHKHKGNEQCMIMAGEFRMNDKVYGPGDFTVAFDGTDHLDLYTENGATLLLVSPPDYDLVAA